MLRGQRIAELRKLAAGIFGSVGREDSVMKLNLYLTPTRLAVLRQLLYQAMVVLFGGIKISVNEGMTITIAPRVGQPRIFPAPQIEAAFLLYMVGAQHPIFRHNRGFEVIRQSNHQMDWSAWRVTCKFVPNTTGKDAKTVRNLLAKTRSKDRVRRRSRDRRSFRTTTHK